jgi:aryl-alcohol dehydrogenase-like predicted oxidoreductase
LYIQVSSVKSLSRLGIDEVDILFLHDIEFVSPEIVRNEAIPYLQALKQEGKVKYIGVTGYLLKMFQQVTDYTSFDCILSYCRFTLHDSSLKSLLPELRAKGIGVINASLTGMEILTEQGAPGWHPASGELKAACQKALALCKEANTNLTQLAMQYAVSHPDITSTLVGTANPQNIINNVDWINQPLNESLLAEVQSIFAPIKSTVWQTGLAINN